MSLGFVVGPPLRVPVPSDLLHSGILGINHSDPCDIRSTVLIRFQVQRMQVGCSDDKLVEICHQSHLLCLLENFREDINGTVNDNVCVFGKFYTTQDGTVVPTLTHVQLTYGHCVALQEVGEL